MNLSNRAKMLKPSATLAVSAKAKEMKKSGLPVISFGTGEPDFDSPLAAQVAGKEAIDAGHTHYTAVGGIDELKEAVCQTYKNQFNLDYSPAEVVVGSGAKPLVYTALAALIDDGDEVIVFTPAFVSYVGQIKMLGGKALLVDTSHTNLEPDPEAVRKVITAKTKAMMINSPNNPTGAVMSAEVLRELAKIAKEHDLVIINDEIYCDLVYEGEYSQIVTLCPDVKDRVVNINGVSKSYAMTGWRIGYATGPAELIKAMTSLQGHITSNAASISQYAAVGAIRGGQAELKAMKERFSARRDLACELLRSIPNISFITPKGAFYVLINLAGLLGKKHDGQSIEDDVTFCSDLLAKKYVAFTPGSAFLAPGTLRLSYASSEEDIKEGLRRLSEYASEMA